MSASMGNRLLLAYGRLLIPHLRLATSTYKEALTTYNLHKLFQSKCSLSTCSAKPTPFTKKPLLFSQNVQQTRSHNLSTLITSCVNINCNRLLPPSPLPQVTPCRTKTRFSRKKGKPKTVHAVIDRFYRLDWGAWIRTRAGRRKKLWKKSSERKYRLRQHVFCTKNQSKLLNAMVTNYWKKPRHYVDDPYAPYHKRTNFNETPVPKPPFLP